MYHGLGSAALEGPGELCRALQGGERLKPQHHHRRKATTTMTTTSNNKIEDDERT